MTSLVGYETRLGYDSHLSTFSDQESLAGLPGGRNAF